MILKIDTLICFLGNFCISVLEFFESKYREVTKIHLDETETRITSILETADAEFNIWQIQAMGQLTLERLVSHWYDGQRRLS